jgi:hypothetical protein
MTNIIIKKGSMELKMDRDDLIEVQETPDGMSFSFKNKFQLLYTDTYMDAGRKQIIKNSSNSYDGKKLVFDFDNKRHPVMVHGDE